LIGLQGVVVITDGYRKPAWKFNIEHC